MPQFMSIVMIQGFNDIKINGKKYNENILIGDNTKGQLISEAIFLGFNASKKPTKLYS